MEREGGGGSTLQKEKRGKNDMKLYNLLCAKVSLEILTHEGREGRLVHNMCKNKIVCMDECKKKSVL